MPVSVVSEPPDDAGAVRGRIAAIEILKSTLRTREYVEKGEGEGKTLLDAMRSGSTEGMQYFDGEIERLIREGIVSQDVGFQAGTTDPATTPQQSSSVLETTKIVARYVPDASANYTAMSASYIGAGGVAQGSCILYYP